MNKFLLRSEFLQKRKELSAKEIEEKNEAILENIKCFFEISRIKTIHIFLPQLGKTEIDTWRIISFLRNFDQLKIISPRTIPGVKNGMFLSTGLEHNVFGKPAEGVGDRVMEMEKRQRKFAGVPEAITPFYVNHEDTECDLLLVGITSTGGAIDEACEALEAEGKKVNHLHLRWRVKKLQLLPDEAPGNIR